MGYGLEYRTGVLEMLKKAGKVVYLTEFLTLFFDQTVYGFSVSSQKPKHLEHLRITLLLSFTID